MNDFVIDCAQARALMLSADPAELSGQTDSALAHHLASCNACAELAARITGEASALADALDTLTAQAALSAPHAATHGASRTPMHTATATTTRRRAVARVAAPLAAAAMLLLALWRMDEVRKPVAFAPILLPPARVTDVTVVNAPATGSVAVMRTSDPNITVVWHF